MIFKNRKKAAKKAALNDDRVQREVQIELAIEAAGQIADPVEKLLRLDEIRRDTIKEDNREYAAIDKKAHRASLKTSLPSLAVMGGAAAAAFIVTGGAAVIAVVPIAVIGMVATSKHEDLAGKKLEAEAGNHFKKIEEQRARVAEMSDAVIENNVKEISQSPRYEEVLALPGISGKFAAAAAKQFVKDAAVPVDQAAPPVEETTATPPRKKQKLNYDKISKVK